MNYVSAVCSPAFGTIIGVFAGIKMSGKIFDRTAIHTFKPMPVFIKTDFIEINVMVGRCASKRLAAAATHFGIAAYSIV